MNNTFLYINNIFNNNNNTPNHIIHTKINNYFNKYKNFNFHNLDNNFFIGFINNNSNIYGNGLFIKNNILIEGLIQNNTFYNSNCSFLFNNNISITFNGSILNNSFHKGSLKYNNLLLNGQFYNGFPNYLCNLNHNFITYTGSWSNGKKHGYGILKHHNNLIYDGEWSNDLYHGTGILYNYNNNNIIYNGDFFQGFKHGKGTIKHNDSLFFVEYNFNKQISKLTSEQKKNFDLININNKLKKELDSNNIIIHKQENTILEYNKKLNTIQKDFNKIKETLLCKICFKNNSNILVSPCNHISTCDKCILKITNKKCPICRATFISTKNIFIS